jgi:predicted CoA-binding protein
MDDINTLRRILRDSRVLAVVGLSADWFRPSYFAAKYMQEHGYRVIPETVLDRCVKIEHGRLFGGLNWVGVNTRVISAKRPRWLAY